MSRLIASSVLISIVSVQAYAADLPIRTEPPVPAPPIFVVNDIIVSNNQARIDFTERHFDYGEYGNPNRGVSPGLIDSERGWTPGFSVSASSMRNWFVDNFYAFGEFTYTTGKSDYSGSFSGVPDDYGSVKQKHDSEVKDLDFRLGKGIFLNPTFMLTPYIGAGYHEWSRDSSRSEGGSLEEYSNGYAGAGLLVQFSPFSRFVVSANGLVGSTFGSYLDVTKTPAGIPPFHVDLGDSLIYKVGLSGDYAITQTIHVNAGVDYTHFEYGESARVSSGAYEPDSRTGDLRFKVGFGYAY